MKKKLFSAKQLEEWFDDISFELDANQLKEMDKVRAYINYIFKCQTIMKNGKIYRKQLAKKNYYIDRLKETIYELGYELARFNSIVIIDSATNDLIPRTIKKIEPEE